MAAARQHDEDTSEYWTRLNYGLAAVRQGRVCIADGFWSYALQLELPEVPKTDETLPRLATAGFFKKINSMTNATQSLLTAMKASVKSTVGRILDLVPDINPRSTERTRTSRGLIDFVGKVQSYLFGTATEGDVEEMKKLIKDVETEAETAAADASRTREGLVSFTRIQEERMTNFRKVLEEEHKTVEQMYTQLRAATSEEQIELNTVAYATQALARYVTLHDQLFHLLTAVEDLVYGQLTPRIIEMNLMKDIFANVSTALQREGKELCPTTPTEIYTGGNYEFARKGQSLYIRIKLAYTVKPRMDVFRMEVFPIPVPGEQQLTTKLKDVPRYVLMNEGGNWMGELRDEPKTPVIHDTEVKWQARRRQSCLAAIHRDDIDGVSSLCDFTVKKGDLQPKYVKIANRKYIVSNLTMVHVACRGASYEPLSREPCSPCFLSLSCSCAMTAGEMEVVAENASCDNYTSKVEVSHAVNLAVLQAFYELTNETLTGSRLLDQRKLGDLQPINFPFFGDSTKKLLAADEAAGYSLKKLTESLQNDTVILHTPAEAIIHDYLQRNAALKNFELLSWSTWLTILPWVAVALIAAVQFRMFLRVRALTIAMTAIGYARVPKVGAFLLRTEPPTTTETPAWMKAVTQIRHEDIGLVAYLILLTFVIIGLIIAVRKALARRSVIYIDIESSKGIMQIKFHVLPNATRNFKVGVSKRPTKLTCTSFGLVGVIRFASKPWKIVDERNGQRIKLPGYVMLPFWTFKRVKNILDEAGSRINPLIAHSHEFVYHNGTMRRESVDPAGYSEMHV